MLQVIAGYEAQDGGSFDAPIADHAAELDEPTADLRIGMLCEYFYEGLAGEVQDAVLKTLCAAEAGARPAGRQFDVCGGDGAVRDDPDSGSPTLVTASTWRGTPGCIDRRPSRGSGPGRCACG
jgi:hypothetical protein